MPDITIPPDLDVMTWRGLVKVQHELDEARRALDLVATLRAAIEEDKPEHVDGCQGESTCFRCIANDLNDALHPRT